MVVSENLNPEQRPPPLPEGVPLNDPSISSLSRQNSLLSLTLDEIQCKSGRSFGSMNMDEFLANIWLPDEDQFSFPSQPNKDEAPNNNNVVAEPTFSQQGTFSIPNPICKKTVDEVWSEIHKDQAQGPQHDAAKDTSNQQPLNRQQTFGVNDFGRFPSKGWSSSGIKQSNMVMTDSADTNAAEKCRTESSGNNNKRRIIDGPPEVVVERRQRRMLKNRESAARSRARKQAYTVELEAELEQLKYENEQLKQSIAELDKKWRQKVEKRKKKSAQAQRKAEKLRTVMRTRSLP
ncbi:Protein ABSCISIC ACID-INSENSITIVE 5 [Quillaja saponaria]|uniref:Protein ABSCISIC ACID-INSENSITIVE 5 n=1 Tax=Quillaja saponaria TaxID=32244 RepID=A0AAD7VMT5_QUISA|nr:Protein ABSCISIC ACID-INSENSITIVE 5 [Quillaja saponaria]KAJ7981160.1 Protein ABSCISIC ACID-INSENSITIVE 5 [Quillaja saponaria]